MPKVTPPDYAVKQAYSQSIIDGKITENMLTTQALAKKMGISDSGFRKKRRDVDTFDIREFRAMIKALKMSDSDVLSFLYGKKTDVIDREELPVILGKMKLAFEGER